MEENPYIFDLLAGILYAIVGMRLFVLGRKTRGRPERLLALTYLAAGVSYLLYEAPYVIRIEPQYVLIAARIIYTLGIIPLLLFTRDVFRRDAGWADALIAANLAALFSGVLFSMLAGDLEGLDVRTPWFWFDWLGYTVPYVWISAEALLAYGAAKKRVRIGLSEPAAANRFLLWALFGIFAALGSASLLPLYLEFAATQQWPTWGDYVSGGLETASTVALWFVFFPPRFYLRWIDRAASVAITPEA